MKRLFTLTILLLITGLLSVQAQKRYDQLTYPDINEFQMPEVETFTLDNGITFYLVENHELPLIDLRVIVRAGGVLVPNEKAGLASMTGTVMRSGGTENYPADTLNQILENRAASMETGIGFSSGSASMNVLKEDFNEMIPIFVDLLRNPAFPQEKIDLAKTQQKSAISRRNDNQNQIGYREFERLIYGENSVYGRMTEYETIDNISREDLVKFHERHFNGRSMMIGVIGDFDTARMKETLSEAFGGLPAGAETVLDFPEVDYEYERTVNFIDKRDVNQSFVLMGHIGGLRTNPDYPKLQVMNEVLSGGFSGRLFQVVRTDMGLAYSVFGSYGSNTFYPGQFYTGVMTKSSTTAEAIDAIIEQIKRLQNEPISEEELETTKMQFLNSLVFRYDSYEDVLNERMSNAYRGLPDDAFETYINGIKATTIEDVQQVAREYLRPDQMQILVVGNKMEIGDQLQKYGEVREIDISIPQPGGDEEKVTGDAAKGQEVLNRMADALISPETELKSIVLKAEVTQFDDRLPGGQMTNSATIRIDYPDAIEQTIETPQGTQTLILKDGKGILKMMGQERPLPPQYTQGLKENLNRNYLSVALNKDDVDPQYLGTEDFEGESYEKISMTVNEKNLVFLVDTETGYPRLMRYNQFNPQQGQQMEIEERYSNWTVTNGVAYAYMEMSFVDGSKSSETKYESHEVNQ